MRRAARVDATQHDIVEMLRHRGWVWVDLTRVGAGCPDGLAVKPGGRVRMIEIKTATGKLTPDQEQFHARVPGVLVLRSAKDAAKLR